MELRTHCGTFTANGKRLNAVIATANPDQIPGFKRTNGEPSPQAEELARAFPGLVFVQSEPFGPYLPVNTR